MYQWLEGVAMRIKSTRGGPVRRLQNFCKKTLESFVKSNLSWTSHYHYDKDKFCNFD
jgi:predicted metallo-beta-lactamase superfamily hydrolase